MESMSISFDINEFNEIFMKQSLNLHLKKLEKFKWKSKIQNTKTQSTSAHAFKRQNPRHNHISLSSELRIIEKFTVTIICGSSDRF